MTLATTIKAATTWALNLLDLQRMIDKVFEDGWISLWLLDDL
ncbi:MAG: hypothetical protein WCI19_16025 [Betaproteobacteria bacterium]